MARNIVTGIIIPEVFRKADENLMKEVESSLTEDIVNFVTDVILKTSVSEAIDKLAAQPAPSLKDVLELITVEVIKVNKIDDEITNSPMLPKAARVRSPVKHSDKIDVRE